MQDGYEKTMISDQETGVHGAGLTSKIISIFDGRKTPVQIDLEKFQKSNITFGRNSDNDLVLDSKLVSRWHGYFNIDKGYIEVVDKKESTNGLIINGMSASRCVLGEGDILRIDDGIESVREGVLILLNSDSNQAPWRHWAIRNQEPIRIGRNQDNTIVLNHIGVSKLHASIHFDGNECYIKDEGSTNGVFVNGTRISGRQRLQEKDIIVITNTKLIFSSRELFYYSYRRGLGIEAQHIIKTVKNRGKSFNICNDVSLSIKPGELVAIIGGSGAGKTTLMNAISGYSRPTSGQVLINGEELYETYDALKNIIGYVPQQDIVYDNLTLFCMLNYAAKLRLPDDISSAEREKRVQSVISAVELTGKENTMIHQLSGGQKKRASIAVELLSDPNLFFLDEPASGLDPGTERNLMKMLKKMTENGKTIILVTHSTLNLQECDKIIFMGRGGNLCYIGNMKEAEEFFGVDNLVDVYNMIGEDSFRWREKYEKTQTEKRHIHKKSHVPGKKEENRHNAFRQIGILSGRYLQLLLNDRQRLLLLLLQAPALAFLISLVKDGEQFQDYGITKSLLFALSCAAFWIGILNAIQEVCKERNILRREYMTGLHLIPYVLSKFLVLGLLCFLQSAMLTGVFVAAVGSPEKGVLLTPGLELFLTTFLTAFAATGMGVFASSMFKNPDRAMTVAPILLLPQILFSGLLFDLKGVTKYISWFAICRWSMEGYGTTANLNSMKKMIEINGQLTEVEQKAEDFFLFTKAHMGKDWLIMLCFVVGFGILSGIVLKNIKKMSE